MGLKRFRIEVEGADQEDVENELDKFFTFVTQGLQNSLERNTDWECTDEHIHAIKRNGQPLMYGRRVFKAMEREEGDNGQNTDRDAASRAVSDRSS